MVKVEISIVNILHAAKIANAKQLEVFCLHFLCANNQLLRLRSDWKEMSKEEAEYVEENQWPPLAYLARVEAYEKEMARKGEGCVIC